MSDPDDRIADLEIALAHLQQEVADLSDVVREQWDQIARLKKDIERLEATKADAKEDADDADVPPPHY